MCPMGRAGGGPPLPACGPGLPLLRAYDLKEVIENAQRASTLAMLVVAMSTTVGYASSLQHSPSQVGRGLSPPQNTLHGALGGMFVGVLTWLGIVYV